MNWSPRTIVFCGLMCLVLLGLRWLNQLGSPVAQLEVRRITEKLTRSEGLGFERSARFTLARSTHDGSMAQNVELGGRAVYNWALAKANQVDRQGVVKALSQPPEDQDFEKIEFKEGDHGEVQNPDQGAEVAEGEVEEEDEFSVCEGEDDDSEECLEEKKQKLAKKKDAKKGKKEGDSEEEGDEGEDDEQKDEELAQAEQEKQQEQLRLAEEERRRLAEALEENERKEREALAAATPVVSGAGGFYNRSAPSDDPKFDLWLARVIKAADRAETLRLVQAFQSGEISESVFLRIVKEMATDTRPEMKRQALLALSSYQSYDSYIILASIAENEPSSSDLYRETVSLFQAYSNIRHLDLLQKVLGGDASRATQIQATTSLSQMVDRYLADLSSVEPNPDDPSQAQAGDSDRGDSEKDRKNREKFVKALPKLKKIAESSKVSEVRSGLEGVVARIESAIHSSEGSLPSPVVALDEISARISP